MSAFDEPLKHPCNVVSPYKLPSTSTSVFFFVWTFPAVLASNTPARDDICYPLSLGFLTAKRRERTYRSIVHNDLSRVELF